MTATRWWVRLAARWIARLDGVTGQIQMFSLAVTAFSTFSLVLQGFGLGYIVPYLGVGGVVVGLAYTYLYTEGGVWNQVARDRQDLSTNFSGPAMYIDDVLTGVAVFSAVHGRPPDDDELAAIRAAIWDEWEEYREGIDISDTAAEADDLDRLNDSGVSNQ